MKYIIANWKMNMNLSDITTWFSDFGTQSESDKKIILAPSAIHLDAVHKKAFEHQIEVSAQDISIHKKGAHTGDIGAFQLRDFCKYCILGHTETGDSLESVRQKYTQCLEYGLIPIVCFANYHEAKNYIFDSCLLCWEDPKNISAGGVYKETDFGEIEKSLGFIKQQIPAGQTLLYGGSVNEKNIDKLAKISTIDGVLVGNASLSPSSFINIIRALN